MRRWAGNIWTRPTGSSAVATDTLPSCRGLSNRDIIILPHPPPQKIRELWNKLAFILIRIWGLRNPGETILGTASNLSNPGKLLHTIQGKQISVPFGFKTWLLYLLSQFSSSQIPSCDARVKMLYVSFRPQWLLASMWSEKRAFQHMKERLRKTTTIWLDGGLLNIGQKIWPRGVKLSETCFSLAYMDLMIHYFVW